MGRISIKTPHALKRIFCAGGEPGRAAIALTRGRRARTGGQRIPHMPMREYWGGVTSNRRLAAALAGPADVGARNPRRWPDRARRGRAGLRIGFWPGSLAAHGRAPPNRSSTPRWASRRIVWDRNPAIPRW